MFTLCQIKKDMPKVEVDLEYIESLKYEIRQLEDRYRKLDEYADSLNQHELVENAKALSIKLTHQTFEKIMKGLGFDCNSGALIINFLEHNIWDDTKSWEVSLGAEVHKNFKHGYVLIGIIPPSELETAKITLEGE